MVSGEDYGGREMERKQQVLMLCYDMEEMEGE